MTFVAHEHYRRPRFAATAFLVGLLASGISGAGDARTDRLEVKTWNHPSYVDSTEALRGSAELSPHSFPTKVTCTYAFRDEAMQTIACHLDPLEDSRWRFEIDSPNDPASTEVVFWLEAQFDEEKTVRVSEQRRVYFTERIEFDISADPPEVLVLPIEDDDVTVRFVPCCNILGAVLFAQRTPVNPTEVTKGLSKDLVGPFVVLEPDDMVVTTSGLNLELRFDPLRLKGRDAGDLVVFEFLGNEWKPHLNPSFDMEKQTVAIPCASGGTFVLGFPGPRN